MTNFSFDLAPSKLAADLLQLMCDQSLSLSAEEIAHASGEACGIWMMSACASGADLQVLRESFMQAMMSGGDGFARALTESVIKASGGRN